MEFHFVSMKSGGMATILDSNENSRFICFDKVEMAKRYAVYITDHKGKYGTWPYVNLASPTLKTNRVRQHKPMKGSVLMNLLDITHYDRDDIEDMCAKSGSNYFYCHYFEDVNLTSLMIKGQEIDGYIVDSVFRETLDMNIKNM
jgi:hypothetical protein